MKVTLTAFKATEAQKEANCPEMTAEMTCAVAARYSRNDEGIDSILETVNAMPDQDKAVDSIFKMVDYGHASIADMSPVPIFIDGLSIWLTYYIWSVCPKAGGQETSTRYVKFNEAGVISPELAGIHPLRVDEWKAFIAQSVVHYEGATKYWEFIAENYPEYMNIPQKIINDAAVEGPDGHKARLVLQRLKRNYVFDRARYFIPAAAKTNVMLIMAARDWVELVKILASHYVPEAQLLASVLTERLNLVVPRLTKHCHVTEDRLAGHIDDFEEDSLSVEKFTVDPFWVVEVDSNQAPGELIRAFRHHTHRYARIGRAASRVNVKFQISHLAMAEMRDLNRHRTGYKFTSAMPTGFYCASDQQWVTTNNDLAQRERLTFGWNAAIQQSELVESQDYSHAYWGLLGTEYFFEHGSTLDKIAYEIALRTGTGAHYKYAAHYRKVHELLIAKIPELTGLILVGSAEPE